MVHVMGRHAETNIVFDDIALGATEVLTHVAVDCSGMQSMTFYVSTTESVTVYLQFSDDNLNFYDLKAVDDSDRTWTCDAEGICVHGDIAAHYVRLVILCGATGTTVRGIIELRA